MRGPLDAARSAWQATRAGFSSLRGSPRELWIVFLLKILESYNYFSLSRILTLFITEEFGVSDLRAGTLYGLWGTLLTLYGFALGGMIDVLGVKGSLVACFVLNVASRFVMAATPSRTMFLAMLLGPNAIAGALGVPVMTIGVKRFTHPRNRGFAFSLFYSLMNVAALSQGVLMDFFRIGPLRRGFRIPSLPERSLLNSGSRLFLASGCITSLIGLLITFTLGDASPAPPKRPASEAGDDSVHSRRTASSNELELPSATSSPEAPLLGSAADVDMPGAAAGGLPLPRHRHAAAAGKADPDSGLAAPGALMAADAAHGLPEGWRQRMVDLLQGMAAVASSRGFHKYLLMCLFTVCLKQVFRHLDATLPKYQLRAFGCDTPVGLIYSINPLTIVLLVPIVGAMTTGLEHFDMIHYGGWVSALSPFLIVAFNTEWSTAAFVALLSLGEAIWSPRWYDYSMGVAPDGREGIFTALASAPLFAAMLPTGMISGALLQRFCPDNGQCGDRVPDGGGADDSGAAAQAGRRLLALLTGAGRTSDNAGSSGAGSSSASGWLGGMAAAAVAPLVGAASSDPTPGPVPGGGYCDGRRLWAIVGAITLSSPLLVLLTQRWLRPDPADFPKLDAVAEGVRPFTTDGEAFDTNEADPLGLLENVVEAQTLHDAERGARSRPASH